MLLRCFNYVEITQQPTATNKTRNKKIGMNFVNKYEVVSTWDSQTDKATVVIPKNVVVQNPDGTTVALQNLNTDIGASSDALFMRGDAITIQAGYWYTDSYGSEQQYVKLLFQGYISKVYSKLSITLECEDNMYLLKQIKVADQVWQNGKSIQDNVSAWLAGSSFIANGGVVKTQSQNTITTGVGTFYTKSETVAQVLGRLSRERNINSYMKGNELRMGYPTYWPEDVQNVTTPYNGNTAPFQFIFQQNIISDNLQYMRVDDIAISATAQSYTIEPSDDPPTKDNNTKTRKTKMLVYVYSDPTTQTIKSSVLNDTSEIPADQSGERFSFFYPEAQTTQELINYATDLLQKKYYTGFKGSFTTFGMPFIPYGDNIILQDKVLPDRDGTYKVKGVTYTGGAGLGIRQEIFLDYKINV